MSGASTSTYPENLGSGVQLPAELRGRVCLFLFFWYVCPSRYVARHRNPRRCVYVLNLGGMDIRPPDSFSYRSNFRSRSRSSCCSTASGDIFYCSGSRQLNHSSFFMSPLGDIYSFASWQNRHFWGFFGPSSAKKGRTHIVLG